MSCSLALFVALFVPRIDPAAAPHLAAWEKVMARTTNFSGQGITLVRRNAVRKTEDAYAVEVSCLKPNLAWVRFERKPAGKGPANPNDFLTYLSDGQSLFEYDGLAREVTEWPLTVAEPGLGFPGVVQSLLRRAGVSFQFGFDLFCGGFEPGGVARRFDVKLTEEEGHYLHLELRPRLPADKATFEVIRVVLFGPTVEKSSYLPRAVVIRWSDGQSEEAWDIPAPRVNVPDVTPKVFQYLEPAAGWKLRRLKAPGG